jgi:hypothetical protein
MRKWIGISIVSATAVIASGLWAHAQVQIPQIPRPGPGEVRQPPQILSGAEMGFRVDGWEGDIPVGRWVVRSGGKWIEPKSSLGTRRITGY